MSYRYWQAFKQRDGWYYWGSHTGVVPECIGPFKTEKLANAHAAKNKK
jgi:hypothetical protein